MTYLVVALEYGEPLPLGMGYYDHPAGDASCALQVMVVLETENEETALEWGIELETLMNVHHVDIMEKLD